MPSFHEQPFEVRLGAMGDEAESIFEQVHPKGWVRWGLKRPNIQVGKLTLKVRYAPDYLTSDGFVECMGVGKDHLLKLKAEKLVAMMQWNQEMPTLLFVWDSRNKLYAYVTVPQLQDAAITCELNSFPEGKHYWPIHVNDLGAEWASI